MDTKKTVLSIMRQIGVELPTDYENVNLIEEERIDSLQIAQLIMGVEERLDFHFDIESITPEVFSTVASIVAFIEAEG